MLNSMNIMDIVKNRFSLESEENKKISEFISAPSLKGLDELAKFLNCVVYIAKDKIYFFQDEFACVILSY